MNNMSPDVEFDDSQACSSTIKHTAAGASKQDYTSKTMSSSDRGKKRPHELPGDDVVGIGVTTNEDDSGDAPKNDAEIDNMLGLNLESKVTDDGQRKIKCEAPLSDVHFRERAETNVWDNNYHDFEATATSALNDNPDDGGCEVTATEEALDNDGEENDDDDDDDSDDEENPNLDYGPILERILNEKKIALYCLPEVARFIDDTQKNAH